MHWSKQLYVSGSLTLLALGALAVSYAVIATVIDGLRVVPLRGLDSRVPTLEPR